MSAARMANATRVKKKLQEKTRVEATEKWIEDDTTSFRTGAELWGAAKEKHGVRRDLQHVAQAALFHRRAQDGAHITYKLLIGTDGEAGGEVTDNDLAGAHPVAWLYLVGFCRPSQQLLQTNTFHIVINTITAIAVVTVGLSTYVEDPDPKMREFSDAYFEPLWWVDLVVVVVFTLEVVVKVLAKKYRPIRFFYDPFRLDDRGEPEGAWVEGRWNAFDLGVVLATLIPLILSESPEKAKADSRAGADSGFAGFAPILRLLRLARLLKIFKSVEQLQVRPRGARRLAARAPRYTYTYTRVHPLMRMARAWHVHGR